MKWNPLQGSVVGPVFKNPKTNWFLNLLGISACQRFIITINWKPTASLRCTYTYWEPNNAFSCIIHVLCWFQTPPQFFMREIKIYPIACIYLKYMPYCLKLVSVHFYFSRNYQVKNFALSVVHWERWIFMKTRWSSLGEANKIPTMSMSLPCLHKLSTLCHFLEYHPNDSWLLFLYNPWFSKRSIAAVGNILILIHYSLINDHWITTHIAANYTSSKNNHFDIFF